MALWSLLVVSTCRATEREREREKMGIRSSPLEKVVALSPKPLSPPSPCLLLLFDFDPPPSLASL